MSKYYYKENETNIIGLGFQNNKMIQVYKGDDLVWDFHNIEPLYTMLKIGVKNKLNAFYETDNNIGVLANIKGSTYKIYAPSGLDSQENLYTLANGIYLNKNSTHFAGRAATFNIDKLNFTYVKDLSYAFYNCNYITGTKFQIGPKTINIAYTYYNTQKNWNIPYDNIDNITNMAYAFFNTGKGWSFCGPKVTNMAYAFARSGVNMAKCGNNVIDMSCAYAECKDSNLRYAACGPLVENMYAAYKNVNSIIVPICGENVKNFSYAYYGMKNVYEAPCGNNVIDMSYAFYNDTSDNTITIANCGPNTTNMAYAYYKRGVSRVKCGDLVTNMAYAYSYSHPSTVVCGPNVINFAGAYYYSSGFSKIIIGDKVEDMSYTYYHAPNTVTNLICKPNVKNMAYTYAYATGNNCNCEIGVNVINASHAFYNVNIKTIFIDPESKVENLVYFAASANSSTTLSGLEQYVSGNNVTNMYYSYYRRSIKSSGNHEGACGPNVTDLTCAYYFTNVSIANIGPNVIKASQAFAVNSTTPMETGGSSYSYSVLISSTAGPNVEDAYCMFKNQKRLQTIPFECFPKVKNLVGTFFGCSNLQTIINISNVLENGYRAFYECSNAICPYPIYLPDTLENGSGMFSGCNKSNLNIYLPYNAHENFTYSSMFACDYNNSLNIFLYKDSKITNFLISGSYSNNIPTASRNSWGNLHTILGLTNYYKINKINDSYFNYNKVNIYIINYGE